jgi:hypothetical protein
MQYKDNRLNNITRNGLECFIREIKITSVIHKAQDNILASSAFAPEAVYIR